MALIRYKKKTFQFLKCLAKVFTFVFWVSLYLFAIKLSFFKEEAKETQKEWAVEPDNYTKWLFNGPVLGNDEEILQTQQANLYNRDPKKVQEIEARVANMMRVCKNRNLTQKINNNEFFVDYAHNLVWCNIFKAASTYWLYKFNVLGGYKKQTLAKSRETPITLARRKYARPSSEELLEAVNTPGVISFLIVRDPFARLLSAYRDKLENIAPPFYRRLAAKIVYLYGNETQFDNFAKKQFRGGPTFAQFVSYLIDIHKNNSRFDEHWAPYYKFCTPCAANFNVVVKVETLLPDSQFIINEIGLEHIIGQPLKDRRARIRKVLNKSKDGRKTTDLLHIYFKQLNETMLDGLLDIYGIDFEMFGYDPNVYRKYVRKN